LGCENESFVLKRNKILTYIYLKKKQSYIISYLQRQSGADDAQRWAGTQGMQLKISKITLTICGPGSSVGIATD